MIFLPKCRASYIVSEKGHGAGEKGHGAREKGHGTTPCKNWLRKRLFSGPHFRFSFSSRN